jgi:hypothetical protein
MNPAKMGDVLRQATRLRKDMEKVQADLKNRYIQGAAGGDLVEVTVNGQQEVVKIAINPKVFGEAASRIDVALLEDLIVAAVSQGLEKSKALMKQEMEKASGGLAGLVPGLL